jgi:hypothetical protein
VQAAKRGLDLLGAERFGASERLVMAQPAKLAEDRLAIPMSSLVARDRRKLPPRTGGERCDDVLGLEPVIAGNRLVDDGGGHLASRFGGPPGAIGGGGIGEAAGMGEALGMGDAGGIGVSSAAIYTRYH